jgi:hypothetical protein
MSNNKRHNQLLFLTTLSVYLGLVLVGSPPQVLAETSAPHVKFELNKTKFSVQTSFESVPLEKAPHFSELFQHSFLFGNTGANAKKNVFENRDIPAENNQNFIVTRLPRGSLDSLLTVNQ